MIQPPHEISIPTIYNIGRWKIIVFVLFAKKNQLYLFLFLQEADPKESISYKLIKLHIEIEK